MNRWIFAALIGAGLYWLLKEPAPRRGYALDADGLPEGEPDLTGGPDPDSEQELLDEALRESFPASDPPSVSPPRSGGKP